jgi:hypothetical protein
LKNCSHPQLQLSEPPQVRFSLDKEKTMSVPQPIPPEIPVVPQPQPEIAPYEVPQPEIPSPAKDPVTPPGPTEPEIVPEHSPPEVPPLPPEHA